MAEHIFGFGKKVTTDASGVLYDSGGEAAPYNANEEDYFIIRRADFAANTHVFLTISEWSVADYGAATTDYDYIDVYEITGDNKNAYDWVWVERIGGSDTNSGDGLEAGDLPVEYYLESDWVKFVFRSKYRQNYSYTGFKITWETGGSGDTSGITDLEALASTTYTDQVNLKENAGDSKTTIFENITEDGAKTNWDFIPVGQYDDVDEARNGVNNLNYEFTNFNYIRSAGVRVPLSYTAPERSFARLNTVDISNISRKND